MDKDLEKQNKLSQTDNDLERLIRLSKEVSKPWKFTTFMLGALLAFSIYSNISISKKKAVFNFSADSSIESTISQKK